MFMQKCNKLATRIRSHKGETKFIGNNMSTDKSY